MRENKIAGNEGGAGLLEIEKKGYMITSDNGMGVWDIIYNGVKNE